MIRYDPLSPHTPTATLGSDVSTPVIDPAFAAQIRQGAFKGAERLSIAAQAAGKIWLRVRQLFISLRRLGFDVRETERTDSSRRAVLRTQLMAPNPTLRCDNDDIVFGAGERLATSNLTPSPGRPLVSTSNEETTASFDHAQKIAVSVVSVLINEESSSTEVVSKLSELFEDSADHHFQSMLQSALSGLSLEEKSGALRGLYAHMRDFHDLGWMARNSPGPRSTVQRAKHLSRLSQAAAAMYAFLRSDLGEHSEQQLPVQANNIVTVAAHVFIWHGGSFRAALAFTNRHHGRLNLIDPLAVDPIYRDFLNGDGSVFLQDSPADARRPAP